MVDSQQRNVILTLRCDHRGLYIDLNTGDARRLKETCLTIMREVIGRLSISN